MISEKDVSLQIDPESGFNMLIIFDKSYINDEIDDLRWREKIFDAIGCWRIANSNYDAGIEPERYMSMARGVSDDISYDKYDLLEEYAWKTLLESLINMNEYFAIGSFRDEEELDEALMREVLDYLNGWLKYHKSARR